MSKIYEKDIKNWTQDYAVRIVKFTRALRSEGVEFALRDQLLRSGTSIGANVKEGKSSSSRKELIRYYEIALKSSGETNYWLSVISEGYEMDSGKFQPLLMELAEISKVIATIVINLKK